jgi:hypothetical protein
MEFEVEKDPKAKPRELLNGSGAFGCEKLAPHLEEACCAPKLPRQGAGRPQAVKIQGDD